MDSKLDLNPILTNLLYSQAPDFPTSLCSAKWTQKTITPFFFICALPCLNCALAIEPSSYTHTHNQSKWSPTDLFNEFPRTKMDSSPLTPSRDTPLMTPLPFLLNPLASHLPARTFEVLSVVSTLMPFANSHGTTCSPPRSSWSTKLNCTKFGLDVSQDVA